MVNSTLSVEAISHATTVNGSGYVDNESSIAITVFDSIESTNSWLLQQSFRPNEARLCVTDKQTAGRGRRGNKWLSAAGSNVLMSLGWSFASWPEKISGLSLVIGMLVAEHLSAAYDLDVKVKWPNDLMVNDQKLGGILIELVGEQNKECTVVVGLGLNLHQPITTKMDIQYEWTDLNSLGIFPDRNQLIGTLAYEMLQALKAFAQNGFKPLMASWPEYCNYKGRRIRVIDGQDSKIGYMLGVDELGALLLKDDSQAVHVFADSTVSVRLESQKT